VPRFELIAEAVAETLERLLEICLHTTSMRRMSARPGSRTSKGNGSGSLGAYDRASRKPRPVTNLAHEPYTDTEGRPSAGDGAVAMRNLAVHGHTTPRIVIRTADWPQLADPAGTGYALDDTHLSSRDNSLRIVQRRRILPLERPDVINIHQHITSSTRIFTS
jgi:hypothetical protein